MTSIGCTSYLTVYQNIIRELVLNIEVGQEQRCWIQQYDKAGKRGACHDSTILRRDTPGAAGQPCSSWRSAAGVLGSRSHKLCVNLAACSAAKARWWSHSSCWRNGRCCIRHGAREVTIIAHSIACDIPWRSTHQSSLPRPQQKKPRNSKIQTKWWII